MYFRSSRAQNDRQLVMSKEGWATAGSSGLMTVWLVRSLDPL